MGDVALLAVAVALIAANAFFVAVEFSLLAARRGRIEAWAEEGRAGAGSALAGMQSLNLQLAACQLGITVMSLLLGWLIEPVVGGALEDLLRPDVAVPRAVSAAIGVALALSVVSFVHMVVGEMVPKSVALSAPERTLVLLAPVHRAVTTLLRPAHRMAQRPRPVGHPPAAGRARRGAGPGPHPRGARRHDGRRGGGR